MVNALAVFIFRFIESILFRFGQVAAVLRLIDTFAFCDIGVMRLIVRRFLAGHRAIRQALIDARLLVVQALIDLVDARMIGNVLRHRE